jgi:dTDP-4-amino-4,6-dideoxygalactose transaminase
LNPKVFEQRARESIMKQLLQAGIETRPTFYPLSSMPCYAPYAISVDYSTSNYSLYGISLPFYDALKFDDTVYITDQLARQLKDHEAHNPS